jgi:hypothetical protein
MPVSKKLELESEYDALRLKETNMKKNFALGPHSAALNTIGRFLDRIVIWDCHLKRPDAMFFKYSAFCRPGTLCPKVGG